LQYVQDPWAVHWIQLLFDFPLAFATLGLAGYFKNNLRLGLIVGALGRYTFHVLSGIFFFADYAIELGKAPIPYSLGYNSFVGVELIICLLLVSVPQFKKALDRIKQNALE
jgi:thiamine transporter